MKSNSEMAKILIVDDIPHNIKILGSTLATENYHIAYADNGPKALSMAKKNSFDLILLDIMMPEMDGYEVCRILKQQETTKDIPIIFLTARTDTDSIEKAFEIGAQDFISKPFNHRELLSRVRTHLKLRENSLALIEKQKELEKTNHAKDKFFSIIAHDLKNPFSDMTSLAELLDDNLYRYQFDKIERFVKQIKKLSKAGFELLQNLLEWSRAQTNRIDWKPKPISLREIVGNTITLLNGQAERKNITLETSIGYKTTVFSDEKMLQTVIRNLLSNAIKFTDEGGSIQITAREIDADSTTKQNNPLVEISVIDNGIGISEEDISKLFRIDVHHTTIGTSKEKGTGLGLVLCKEFVEKNGGNIKVSSRIGEGSIFSFTLPSVKKSEIISQV